MHALHPLLTLAILFSAALATPISSSTLSTPSPSPSSSSYPTLPTTTTANLTLATINGTSKSLTSQKEVTEASGYCTITGIQSYARVDRGIELTLLDYSGKELYWQRCGDLGNTMCTWPLLFMGDFLVTRVLSKQVLQFCRQGTVSQDAWALSDTNYCTITKDWYGDSGFRYWNCKFQCQQYGAVYTIP